MISAQMYISKKNYPSLHSRFQQKKKDLNEVCRKSQLKHTSHYTIVTPDHCEHLKISVQIQKYMYRVSIYYCIMCTLCNSY